MKFNQFPPNARAKFFKEFLVFKAKLFRTGAAPSYRFNIPNVESEAGGISTKNNVDIVLYAPWLDKPILSTDLTPRDSGTNTKYRVTARKSDLPFDDIDTRIWQVIMAKSSNKGVINIENISRISDTLWNSAIFKRELRFQGGIEQNMPEVTIPSNDVSALGIQPGDTVKITAINLSQDNIGPLREQSTRRLNVFDSHPKDETRSSLAVRFPTIAARANGWNAGDTMQFIVRKANVSKIR